MAECDTGHSTECRIRTISLYCASYTRDSKANNSKADIQRGWDSSGAFAPQWHGSDANRTIGLNCAIPS